MEDSTIGDPRPPMAGDAARDAVVVIRLDTGVVISSNHLARELMGYKDDQMIGLTLEELHPKGSMQQVRQDFERHVRNDGVYSFDIPVQRRDGSVFQADFSTTRIELAGVECIMGIFHDVEGRSRTEEALRQSESHYRLLFETLGSAFALHRIIRDEAGKPCDYRFLEVNDAFEVMTGLKRADLLGRTVLEVLPKVERLWIERYGYVTDTGDTLRFENYSRALKRHYDVTAYRPKPEHFAVIFNDVTLRKADDRNKIQMEKKLQETQKLESLGVLAGGIAHDFNNILMAILGHADIALQDLSPMSPVRDSLKEITRASHRAADLCRQMLAYAGRGHFIIESVDLRMLIDEMAHLLKATISKKALLNLNLAQALPPIKADATQIRQVVMNLVVNAAEAIEERSGSITISSGAMECDRDYLDQNWPGEKLEAGCYVWIEVSDTGCGMDEATKLRVFEPFFTTKFTGRGLGMSAVLGIVRGHSGGIRVYSEVGQGTTFKALFPADLAAYVALDGPDESGQVWEGSGTVLLVDDEETVRVVGGKMLERLGFKVVAARDGREGVETYGARRDDIDLVILDLTMPRMNGEEAYRELRRINPDVVTIISSGYTEQEVATRFAGKGVKGFIQKPYGITTLRNRLQEILEA